MNKSRSPINIKYPGILLICCLLFGFLFDILFYGKTLGISYPLCIAVFLLIYHVYLKSMNYTIKKPEFWLFIPLLILAASFAVHSNMPLLVMNFLTIPFLIIAQTIITAGVNRYHWFDPRFLLDLLEGLFGRTFSNVALPFRIIGEKLRAKADRQRYDVLKRIITGLIVALPLLLVIILLLSSADAVFSHYLGQLPVLLQQVKFGELLLRAILILAVTVFSFAYIYSFRKDEQQEKAVGRSPARPLELKSRWDPITVSTFLTALNLVYFFFIAIQFTYLFGGGRFALPADFTYAEYARQGFFELLVITIINLSIFVLTINFVTDTRRVLFNIFRFLLSLLSVSTLVMLISSFFRLALYEEAYGFTYARVTAHAVIVYLFILFLAALYRIWHEKISLLKIFIVVSLIAYLAFNYFGIDRFIATANIDRYYNTGKIDVHYLTYLSDDAVPQLVTLLDAPDKEVALQIENDLSLRKERLSDQHWQSFNLSRFIAASILKEHQLVRHTLDYPGH